MIKMYNVGFGESILLDNSVDQCLLVDCGSEMNDKEKVFTGIYDELYNYKHRTALITHFHDDHINGFIKMIEKHHHVFDEIYIPNIFFERINPLLEVNGLNLVDLEIVKYLLEQKKVKNGHLSILELLKALVKSMSKIKVAERGDTIQLVGCKFEVLWPNPHYLLDKKTEESLMKTIPILNNIIHQIYMISDQITEIYQSMLENNGEENIRYNLARINSIEERIIDFPSLEVSKHVLQKWLDKIKRIENNTSIVMQSKSFKPSVLLTGDIIDSTMEKIFEDYYEPNIKTYDYYTIIKAPHHGTDSNHFVKFDIYTKFDYIFISNGETNKSKRGKISKKYDSNFKNYLLCCTNNDNERCQYCTIFGRICNRAAFKNPTSIIRYDKERNVIF